MTVRSSVLSLPSTWKVISPRATTSLGVNRSFTEFERSLALIVSEASSSKPGPQSASSFILGGPGSTRSIGSPRIMYLYVWPYA